MASRKAVVVGATGATGEHVLGQLLMDGHWQKVVTVGRREAPVPPAYPASAHKAELQQVVVGELGSMEADAGAAAAFQGADAVFCCLGTTRAAAGSAEGFIKVDHDYVCASARAAKAGGARHFSLVSAKGASARTWANNWLVFHGLLYMRTKGQAEAFVKEQGFPSTSIYQPGLLDRGAHARDNERRFLGLMTSLPTSSLARSMINDAKDGTRSGLRVVTMDQLLKDHKAFQG